MAAKAEGVASIDSPTLRQADATASTGVKDSVFHQTTQMRATSKIGLIRSRSLDDVEASARGIGLPAIGDGSGSSQEDWHREARRSVRHGHVGYSDARLYAAGHDRGLLPGEGKQIQHVKVSWFSRGVTSA